MLAMTQPPCVAEIACISSIDRKEEVHSFWGINLEKDAITRPELGVVANPADRGFPAGLETPNYPLDLSPFFRIDAG